MGSYLPGQGLNLHPCIGSTCISTASGCKEDTSVQGPTVLLAPVSRWPRVPFFQDSHSWSWRAASWKPVGASHPQRRKGRTVGCQYQAVAWGMWQVVQEALEGGGGGRELQRKLRSVAAAMEWARGASRELGGDLASWDCQLQTRLRNDTENRVPPSPRDRVPLNPRDQLGRYLAELAEAMDRGLGPQRAARLGACLSATDRECFQEVLLGRLSVLLTRSGDPDSCRELYTWARKTLFGQLARKTPRPAAARKLLDPLMFVTWMSQVQSRLVELIQLLKGTIDSVQDVRPPVTSRVQAMVLNTFAEFLQRKTWQDLGQAHTPLADLVLCTINAIEDQSQDALVSGVRSLCQSLLGHHFGREDEELARALRSLRGAWSATPACFLPTYKSLVQSLYRAVFTEYLQALVTHLKKLKPRKWEDQQGQVETDVQELRETFGRQEGLCDGAPGLEAFMEVFQLSGERGSPCLDGWLASFRDRFPDYVRRQSEIQKEAILLKPGLLHQKDPESDTRQ
ncbi:hypothetical protein MJT46_012675 [Ovis ammon polii x Ovis aries]|nr:hypothetical protein MJT46_012675 [Ovis ammon polii x Ovis aries]